ncbi:MAG: hypothetical protein KH138_03290, partial [Firmicutes bacterium]|nr:hypothetical protein [Bacillota bacterium]
GLFVLLFRCLPFANFSWVSSCLGLDFLFAGFPANIIYEISKRVNSCLKIGEILRALSLYIFQGFEYTEREKHDITS